MQAECAAAFLVVGPASRLRTPPSAVKNITIDFHMEDRTGIGCILLNIIL